MTSDRAAARAFESGPARREHTRVSVGFVGYSGSGKTFSMLRFAAGMAEAQGGKTVLVDSNLRRSLYYAPKPGEQPVRGRTFDFEVVHLTPPFDPAGWRAAFQHAIAKLGATRVIADCMSDEWEGEGGVLHAHDQAIDEMIGRKRSKGDNQPDWKLRDKLSDTAWIKVKREHLALRLWMWQQPVDWLLSYRAKEKIDRKARTATAAAPAGPGGSKSEDRPERKELGWQPIGADDMVYDLMLRCLLPPSSDGTPNWEPALPAEKLLVKPPPGPIRDLLRAHPQVNEELGYQIARWAAGHDIEIRPASAAAAPPAATATSGRSTLAPRDPTAALIARFDACATPEAFESLRDETKAAWESIPRGDARTRVTRAIKAAEDRIEAAMSGGKEAAPA